MGGRSFRIELLTDVSERSIGPIFLLRIKDPLKTGPLSYPETSVRKYPSRLSEILNERRSHFTPRRKSEAKRQVVKLPDVFRPKLFIFREKILRISNATAKASLCMLHGHNVAGNTHTHTHNAVRTKCKVYLHNFAEQALFLTL